MIKIEIIKQKVIKIQNRIKKLDQELINIQEACLHPKDYLEKKANANTGNYDPSSDCYWYDCHCSLCDKYWREEQ